MKHSQPLRNPSPAVLYALPEAYDDSLGGGISFWNRFASESTTEPFPMYRCAPAFTCPMTSKTSKRTRASGLREMLAELSRLGVEGRVGAGGVVAAHAVKGIVIILG